MEFIDYQAPPTPKVEIGERFIDLEAIIASKNKRLLRFLPKFALKWFEKLLHLDEINASIYNHRDIFGAGFATEVLRDMGIKTEIINPENMPAEGRCLVTANHPLGGIDGMALISEIGKYRSDILFPVNDLLMNLPGLRPVFIPINKYQRNTENHQILDDAFRSKHLILFFPAGLCSRKIKGVVQDLEWKKTFIKKAVEYQRDIIPVFVDAVNSNRFYNFANFRKKIGIKANIELILLPGEMYRQKNKIVKLIFGKPIPFSTFDKSKKDAEWALLVRKHVYQLKTNPNAIFQAR